MPYYWNYSIITIILKPIRKWLNVVVIPNCPFANIRILLYRLIGFKIGKNCFIGMRCYLDDMCYDKIHIGNNVTISYGVYFTCHSPFQQRHTIYIDDNTYIGMNASITATTDIVIGQKAIIGACTLVNKSIPPTKKAVGIPCRIID